LRTLSLVFFLAITVSFAPLVQAQESDILVTKSGPSESAADTDVSYSVGVTNFGPDDSATVTLTDAIPSGMTFVSAVQEDGPSFSCAAPTAGDTVGTINCSIASMTNGSTANFTFVFHIPPATPPGTSFTNVANVTSPTDPNSENDTAAAVTNTPFPPQGDLFIVKTGPSGAGADTDVVYTISLTNGGPDDATNVTMNDTLSDVTFVSIVQDSGPPMVCSDPGGGNSGLVSCSIATFPADATATFTLTAHVPPGASPGSTISNTATVTSDSDPNEENDSSSTLLTVSSSDVSVVKTGSATATAGTNLSYTITVTNNGPDTAFDVTLEDQLPPDTTFFSLTPDSGPVASCVTPVVGANGTVSCNFIAIANTVSAQFTLVVEIGNTLSVTNTATVSASGTDSNTGNNSSTQITAVTPSADVAVTKNAPATAEAGTNVAYTITVTNEGPSDAEDVTLTDTVPVGTTFVSMNQTTGPTFNCSGTSTITCTIASLAPGALATFTYTVNVPATTADGFNIANTADVTTSTADANSGNDTATANTTVEASADLSVVKTGPGSADPDTDVTYTVTVTNNGPSDATSVSLTDTTPANTTFVSIEQTSGPLFICVTPSVGGTGTITCTIATLVPGATAIFSIVLHVSPSTPDASAIANTADLSSNTSDPNAGNNTSTTTAFVGAIADLNVTKTGPANAAPDSDVTYVVTVTNNGPSDAASVTLTDELPAGTTFVSATQTSGPIFNCVTPAVGANGTITCTIATLASGATATFDIVLHVGAVGLVVNTATVTSPTDPAGGNNSGSAATAVVAPASLTTIPTLSPLALMLMALSLAGIVLFVQRQ
jgi:uncharacterized repeat protein (TIGR01451 family)